MQNLNSLVVQAQTSASVPSASLSVSENPVTMCNAITLTLGSFVQDGKRGLGSFVWSVAGASSHVALSQFLGAQTSSSVIVDASLLAKNVEFSISVGFRNFIGAQGSSTIVFTSTGCVDFSISFAQDLQSLIFAFTLGDFTLQNTAPQATSTYSSALCTYLFSQATLAKFGTQPTCQ